MNNKTNNVLSTVTIAVLGAFLVLLSFLLLSKTCNAQSYHSSTTTIVTSSGTVVLDAVRTSFSYDNPNIPNTVKQAPVVVNTTIKQTDYSNIPVYYEQATIKPFKHKMGIPVQKTDSYKISKQTILISQPPRVHKDFK